MPSHLRIDKKREALGLSYSELARRVGKFLPGIDSSDVRKICMGFRKVKADEVPAFAAVLECEILDLLDPKPHFEPPA